MNIDAQSLLDHFEDRVRHGLPVHGVVVERVGEEPLKRMFRAEERENVYSGAKTFTALGIGIARDAALLELDDPVLSHFPDYRGAAAPGVEEMRLWHLLTMTSGSPYTLFTPEEKQVSDIVGNFLSKQRNRPGARFEYSSGCSYLLSRVISRVTGMSLSDYLVNRLFTPLGIWNPLWGSCPEGYTWGGTDLHLTTAEYARLGSLLLGNGEFKGHRIVSREWIELMRNTRVDSTVWTDDPEGTGYGLHVWHCSPEGVYRADGRYGQHCVIMPAHGACVTVTAHHEGRANDILDVIWEGAFGSSGAS